MLKESDHIDKLFADYLSDYEEKAPGYVWQNIQADIHNRKRLKYYSKLRAIAASIALLLTFGLGYLSSDLAQKEKFEARYLDLNSLRQLEKQLNSNPADTSLPITKKLNDFPNSDNAKKIIVKTDKSSEIIQLESKIFSNIISNLSQEQFLPESGRKANSNNFASTSKKSVKSNSNQLLIDTLLLEEGDLPDGGFLLSKKTQKPSRWSFGTKFSPVYSLAESQDQISIDNGQILKSSINSDKPNTHAIEKSLLAFSGGLNVNYRFANRWSVESGLFYSQRRQMADNLIGSSMNGMDNEMIIYTPEGVKQLSPDFNSPTEITNVIGSSRGETFYSSDLNYISNFDYLELPILVRYKIIDRKFGFDILSGISTNFLIGNRSSIVQDDISLWTGQTQEISPLLYNATLGLGLNYNFYQNFSFNLEPTFKYTLINSESNTLVQYPYSFAVFAGFSYRFK